MSKYFIEDTTLTAIADAVRDKTGTTDLILVSELPTAIANIPTGGGGGGGDSDIPEEAFIVQNNCQYKFMGGWDWFINLYGDKITTKNISNGGSMFNQCITIKTIPFDFNFSNNATPTTFMFSACNELEYIGDFINFVPNATSNMFNYCYRLRALPNFINMDVSNLHTQTYTQMYAIFANCYSLRYINPEFLKEIYTLGTGSYYQIYNAGFNNCVALDELRGIPVAPAKFTSNMFGSAFYCCSRVKDIIFDTNEDGTPKVVEWKSQTLDLGSSQYVGYAKNQTDMIKYNSGITDATRIDTNTEYEELKDNPDAWTNNKSYSRYNHDSAVRTINSLPDTSAYLATAGGTNTIKFDGSAGSGTKNADGTNGAISKLTEEEIAVAAAKGWTVTFG